MTERRRFEPLCDSGISMLDALVRLPMQETTKAIIVGPPGVAETAIRHSEPRLQANSHDFCNFSCNHT